MNGGKIVFKNSHNFQKTNWLEIAKALLTLWSDIRISPSLVEVYLLIWLLIIKVTLIMSILGCSLTNMVKVCLVGKFKLQNYTLHYIESGVIFFFSTTTKKVRNQTFNLKGERAYQLPLS